MLTLRPYQSKALDDVRALYRAGTKRVLLHSPTGSGKTVIFCEVLKGGLARGKRCIIAVRGILLVDQAAERLRREHVPFGIYQGNHPDYDPDQPIQICSIDTLYARRIAPPADLIVIDEADTTGGAAYEWFLAQYKDVYLLPVTATPHRKGGMRHVADDVVKAISVPEAIEQGYLVGGEYYGPTRPDLTGVKTDYRKGDYVAADLFEAMDKPKITGDIVGTYRKNAFPLPAVCFAVSVKHSRLLEAAFLAAGIKAEHLEASTPIGERHKALERLRTGQTQVICNVGILCRGVDMPWLRVVIMARPTQSYNLHIQQLGRGTRPFDGKESFLVLDHAGNVMRHGMIEDEKDCNLDEGPGKPTAERSNIRTCQACFAIYPVSMEACPACGEIPEKKPREYQVVNGELKKYKKSTFKPLPSHDDLMAEVTKLVGTARFRGYKPGWAYHIVKAKYGPKAAKIAWKIIK